MSPPLKVGIAGYGVVGKRRREVIDAHPALKTVAVSDKVLDGDGIFDDGVAYCDDFRKLLERDLDVLFVCLSNDVAAEATIGGLTHDCHVFCEKPPGRNVREVEEVIAEYEKHPELLLMYGFNHRYHDSVREALRIIRSGELGEVINLRGVYGKSKLISYGQTTWRTNRDLAGGGILLDQGIHMVDLLRLFAGEFEEIHSFVSNSFWKHDVEDNAYAMMRTADGKIAMLHSSATSWRHRFNLDITLSKGAITLSGILSGSKSYGAETLTVTLAGDEMGDPKEQTTRFNTDSSWEQEVDDFATGLRAGERAVSGSADEALKTIRLVYRIYDADPDWRAQWGRTS